MHVELEKVEEWVVDHGDRAVELGLDAVVELERLAGFVAYGEGNPLDLVSSILYMLARFSASRVSDVSKVFGHGR